ncbi:MAG: hypothetical protein SGJ07_09040 [Rhodospirillaceae bacterium]|nr:hypothetical protein [Rhodospirillaceae bacterium]
MKRTKLLVALATAAGVSLSGVATAKTTDTDAASLEAALAKGSTGLQELLSQNPDNELGNQALDGMIQLAKRGENNGDRGFERSGNPNANGSPDNRGVGNPNTPDC